MSEDNKSLDIVYREISPSQQSNNSEYDLTGALDASIYYLWEQHYEKELQCKEQYTGRFILFQEIEEFEKKLARSNLNIEEKRRYNELKELIKDLSYIEVQTINAGTRIYPFMRVNYLRNKIAQWFSTFNLCITLLTSSGKEITDEEDDYFLEQDSSLILQAIVTFCDFTQISNEDIISCILKHLEFDDEEILHQLRSQISEDRYITICNEALLFIRQVKIGNFDFSDPLYFYFTGADHPSFVLRRPTDLKKVTYLINNTPVDINKIEPIHGHDLLMWVCSSSDFWRGVRVVPLVKLLISRKADPHAVGPKGQFALIYACQKQDPEVVSLLLLEGKSDINRCDTSGKNALHWSVKKNNSVHHVGEAVTRILLCLGADVHKCDKNGFTPLIWACIYQRVGVIEMLIEAKSDIHQRCHKGMDPLMWACRSRFHLQENLNVIKILLSHHANIHHTSNNGMDALMWSSKTLLKDFCTNPQFFHCTDGKTINRLCYDPFIMIPKWRNSYDRPDLIKFLIAAQAELNRCDHHGKNALIYSGIYGNFKIAQVLLTAGMNIDTQDARGCSSLMYAVECGFVQMTKVLLSSHANVHLCNNDGRDALIFALKRHDYEWEQRRGGCGSGKKVLELLLNANACPLTRDRYNKDALAYIYIDFEAEKVQLLISAKANIHKKYNRGISILSSLILKLAVNLDVLVSLQCNIHDSDDNGVTPFLLACSRFYQIEFLQKLISLQANIHDIDKDGKTCLHYAVSPPSSCYEKVIEFLLNQEADINARMNDGSTVFSSAVRNPSTRLTTLNLIIEATKSTGLSTKNDRTVLHLDISDNNGRSPLMWSSIKDDPTTLLHLINGNADINKCDRDGCTALILAWAVSEPSTPSVRAVETLIAHAADIHRCDHRGQNALFHTMNFNLHDHRRYRHPDPDKYYETVAISLLTHQAYIHHRDVDGMNAFTLACKNGYNIFMNTLITYQADINSYDNIGKTGLVWACINDRYSIVQGLLERKVDAEMCDKNNMNALIWASKMGHSKIVDLLLSFSVDLTICDHDGMDALLWASRNLRVPVVKQLLTLHADPEKQNKNGNDACTLAMRNGPNPTTKLLTEFKKT